MDEETAALIVQLQLDDIEVLRESSKGKEPEATQSDADISLAAYKEDLLKTHLSLQDRILALSIGGAAAIDADLLQQIMPEEETASRDRALALSLGEVLRGPGNLECENTEPVEQIPSLSAAVDLGYF